MPSKRTIIWGGTGLAILVAVGVGCGIAVQRDLSAIPPGQVGFDDMCGLQEYFDALEIKSSPPPRIVSAADIEGQSGGKVTHGGKERFAFENDYQLKHLRRVLNENWRRLPPELATASPIEIEVHWSEKAGAKRVVTDQESEISAGGQTWELPYHPCLSELLYGAPLYKQRREMWGLPLTGTPPDAGAGGPPPISTGPLVGGGDAGAPPDGGHPH
ncbi:MAG TPA: hypothetical protein VKZ18_22890 [Polyangia bacterium]|nr:hypothetical protein [Polyangia bacterium]